MRDRDRGQSAIGEAHCLRGPSRAQFLQKEGDAFIVGNEFADPKIEAVFPA
jgi:hypothetical protein